MIKKCMNVLVVINIILLFNISLLAETNDSLSIDKEWNSIFNSCPSNIKEYRKKLLDYKKSTDIKLTKLKEQDFKKILKSNSQNSEIIRLLFPYMIPEGVTSKDILNSCWVYLYEFYDHLKKDDLTKTSSSAKAWKSCLGFSYKKTPKTAQQILKCYNEVNK